MDLRAYCQILTLFSRIATQLHAHSRGSMHAIFTILIFIPPLMCDACQEVGKELYLHFDRKFTGDRAGHEYPDDIGLAFPRLES